MSHSIDVVVPVYGHYELTSSCLEHLARQTAGHRVIVVDDGSKDGTPDRIRSDWPDVTLVVLPYNQGYTRAVNRGVSAGDGDYVVLLNNDVLLDRDFLANLVRPLEDDELIGSVASLMLTPPGELIDSFGVSADPTLAGFARLQGKARGHALSESLVLCGPEGTAGAYRRKAWEEVGGFDEEIPAYMEILDLALRLQSHGWKAAQAPDATGIHLGSQTYGQRSARQRRLAGFSRAYLLRRYGLLHTRMAPRTLFTEALVVAADAVICRDLQALTGRIEGWRRAYGLSRLEQPPVAAIDHSISLWRSLKMRHDAVRS